MLNVTLTKRVAGYWPHLVAGEQHINPFALQKHLLRVSGELWRYFQGYDCMARGANQSVVKQTNWYIQDEVGLSVGHSDKPNVRCLPFLYLDARGQMTPFSVLWPIRSIALGEELTRDFCPSWLGDAKQRQGYLQSIFKAPTQAALNAYQELQQSLAQTARSATKANLPTTPMPVSPAKRVFVSEATPEIKEAIAAAGFETVESKEEADIVLDDTACAGKVTNQHPLNSIFGSTEKTVLALQSVAGAQDWLCPSFHLSTQICEFTGAVLMGQNSWWMLASDQGYSGEQLPRVVTNCWAAAVRHVDVGYTSAIKFMPPVVTSDQVHVAERLALLTPSNGLYTWRDNTWIYIHQIQLRDNKPEPFQTLMPAVEVDERLFIEQLRVRHGGEAFVGVVAKMDVAIVDLMSLMLGIGSSDSSAFGVFRFRFALEKNAGGIAPLLQEVRPVRVSELLASSQQLVPAILCALAETPDDKCWKQAGA
ncbi:hypothetical protein H4R26_005716 [Coemansia thaxteri]|uniref:Tubulin--tyrosine ligase-like protein 12 SET-like domain-containing protein n=1 Tax=Coemansia thaxteri TaxID=2663907 RepID=A0A9W8B751_9FUNG|nr:hypothetical protein H4R26_005716 [Coemansia thaxteri]